MFITSANWVIALRGQNLLCARLCAVPPVCPYKFIMKSVFWAWTRRIHRLATYPTSHVLGGNKNNVISHHPHFTAWLPV